MCIRQPNERHYPTDRLKPPLSLVLSRVGFSCVTLTTREFGRRKSVVWDSFGERCTRDSRETALRETGTEHFSQTVSLRLGFEPRRDDHLATLGAATRLIQIPERASFFVTSFLRRVLRLGFEPRSSSRKVEIWRGTTEWERQRSSRQISCVNELRSHSLNFGKPVPMEQNSVSRFQD